MCFFSNVDHMFYNGEQFFFSSTLSLKIFKYFFSNYFEIKILRLFQYLSSVINYRILIAFCAKSHLVEFFSCKTFDTAMHGN